MKFKDRLKELRYENSLTQKDIADGCKLSTQCISQLELGTRNPTGSTLEALADFFEVSTDYLLGREDDFGNISVQNQSPLSEQSPDTREMIDIFNSLDRFHRAQVLEYARYFQTRTQNAKRNN